MWQYGPGAQITRNATTLLGTLFGAFQEIRDPTLQIYPHLEQPSFLKQLTRDGRVAKEIGRAGLHGGCKAPRACSRALCDPAPRPRPRGGSRVSAREPARGERASEEALYKRTHFIGSHTHVRGTLLELPSVQHGRQQHCAACIGRKLPDCLHVDHAGDRGAILTGDSGLRAAIG